MVATSSPLAVAAALEVWGAGGSALDAAIAADAVLGVVQPMATGLGGDLFALVEAKGEIRGYNGSGAAPSAMRPVEGAMPARGGTSITVPGHVEGWAALHVRFGRVDLSRCLDPAVRLARGGFPVGPVAASVWRRLVPELREGRDTAETFLVDGRAPTAGERVANPAQGRVLEEVGRRGAPGFYEGWPGEAVVRAAGAAGSALAAADLVSHEGEWVTPLEGRYGGWHVLELPPNSQGAVVIGALGVLDGVTLEVVSPSRVHRHVEAVKAAFSEASRRVGDPRTGGGTGALCDPTWASTVRASLSERATEPPPDALPTPGGTVYVAVADGDMTVSLITSNFFPFGSLVAVPECGFVLQNRGGCFRSPAPEGHPNRAAPGRRPYHTIIPALVRRPGGERWGALGVVGGDFQPQGHVQLLHHLAAGMEPQAALDAPRWRWPGGRRLALEPGLAALGPELEAKGHVLEEPASTTYGGAQLVLEDDGFLVGACEGRQDSLAAGW